MILLTSELHALYQALFDPLASISIYDLSGDHSRVSESS